MSKNISKVISSNQSGVHEDLVQVVISHRDSRYQKPFQDHNLKAFDRFVSAIQLERRPMILDSCCGTGMSSVNIAEDHPEHWVVGLDQSEVRLGKRSECPENLLLLRANCEDFWRLCLENQVSFEKHFILYPNPWPKKSHLKRRWHGHPVFDVLPKLSPSVELRSNWKIYLDEFALAWHLITGKTSRVETFTPENYLTLFEKKYHQSEQALYRLLVES